MKDFEREFIDFAAGVWQSFGLDPLSSQLVGIIFLEPEEVSMEDLAKKTGYSLPSLSNKLRMLEGLMLVKRVKKPGTKKAFYYIEKDVYSIMLRKLQSMQDRFIQPAKNTIPGIIERNKGSRMNADEKRKMEMIQTYYKQLLEVETCLAKHRQALEKMRG
ncbi:hypothetical protein KY362_05255 [Candidatus Woesearchaeota archaeon]|nr:hypothetical protein [Candidatus Woesearchaeota archaeon]